MRSRQFWRLKSNIDSGLFEAVQLAGIAALDPAVDADVKAMNAIYARRRDLVCDALAQSRGHRHQAEGHDLHLGADSRGLRELGRLLRARARARRGRDLPGGAYGASGEGFFRISLTTPDDRLLEAVERLRRLRPRMTTIDLLAEK